MKRLFLLLLIVLAGGAWIGEKMVQDPGYVLLAYEDTTIESSLWVLMVILFCAFLVMHWAVNLFFKARIPTGKIRDWRERRQHKLAQRKTLKGLIALSEGRWWKAQRLLNQSAEKSGQPLVNYLSAARAAHEQGEEKLADTMLQQARNSVPQAELAIGMTQAQLQFERGQLEPCLANLIRLRRMSPQQPVILRLLKDVYVRLQDWQGLTSLLVDLKKQKVIDAAELEELEQRCYSELLGGALTKLPVEADNTARLSALNKEWKSIPATLSSSEPMVKHYVELMIEAGSEDKAEKFLSDKLKKNWDEGLVKLYGRVQGPDAHKQLETAKGWLKKHPESAGLKLTLARLSMRNKHWGKAVDYLEDSLAIEKSVEASSELSRVLQHLGEHEKAMQLMQDGLLLSSDDLPPLPVEGSKDSGADQTAEKTEDKVESEAKTATA